jgi:hypothetical protein
MPIKHPRAKGNRNRRKAIDYYTSQVWLVDVVEKTGKFVVVKDLYSLFDLIGVKENKTILIQVKTNKPDKLEFFQDFANQYGGDNLLVEMIVYYDREGPTIHKFKPDAYEFEDLRK